MAQRSILNKAKSFRLTVGILLSWKQFLRAGRREMRHNALSPSLLLRHSVHLFQTVAWLVYLVYWQHHIKNKKQYLGAGGKKKAKMSPVFLLVSPLYHIHAHNGYTKLLINSTQTLRVSSIRLSCRLSLSSLSASLSASETAVVWQLNHHLRRSTER